MVRNKKRSFRTYSRVVDTDNYTKVCPECKRCKYYQIDYCRGLEVHDRELCGMNKEEMV